MKKQTTEKSKLILEYEAKIKEFEKTQDMLENIPNDLLTDKQIDILNSQNELLNSLIEEYECLIDAEKERQSALKEIEKLSNKLKKIEFKYTLVIE